MPDVMRLFDAIVDANHRAASGDKGAGLRPSDFTDSLPIVCLTCIDPRLNLLMPGVLGIPEDQFIWLRNAGNIIFDSMSSMTRTLALACAIKGGREIAIIGHTDCKVRQTSVLQLTDRFQQLGINRSQLPENLTEFFGLFASERQNVLRGVEFIRKSPLIGPKIPVHGLVVDIQTGRLEWVVNGYQALETVGVAAAQPFQPATNETLGRLAAFDVGEMKFPTLKIGESATAMPVPGMDTAPALRMEEREERKGPPPLEVEVATTTKAQRKFDHSAQYKVMDAARKVFGPVSGKDLEQWLQEGRIDLNTLTQKLGYKEWRPLNTLLQVLEDEDLPSIPIPPKIASALRFTLEKGKKLRQKDS